MTIHYVIPDKAYCVNAINSKANFVTTMMKRYEDIAMIMKTK